MSLANTGVAWQASEFINRERADGRLLSLAAQPGEMKLYIALYQRVEEAALRAVEIIAGLDRVS